MSKGSSGHFIGTRGYHAAAGSAIFMSPDDDFIPYISSRRDVDANGFYDVIAHGTPNYIEVMHNSQVLRVSHRTLAQMLKHNTRYRGEAVRLLSCSTGSAAGKFAQNLANKLGVPVKAPTDILWAQPNGVYYVAGQKIVQGTRYPDFAKPGKFKTFYPRKEK